MLKRSKKAKLTIQSRSSFLAPNSKISETIRSCFSEMNRVEEIKLFTVSGLILEDCFRVSPKSAPHLRILCIGSHSFSYVESGFSIPEDFLYDTERLRRVELINCKISWDSRLLTGLTRLSLENCLDLEAKSSIIQFLHALQRMPALTDLHLKDSIPEDLENLSTYPVVDLPYLRVLHIASGVRTLTTVLRHITMPPTTTWSLTCRGSQSTVIDFTNFFSVLATKFFPSLVVRKLSLRVLDGADLEFRFWTSTIISSPSQSQLVLSWTTLPVPHSYAKVLTCAFDGMSLPFLTQLDISTMECIDSETWVKTFGTLPLLKQVYVHGSASPSFFEALLHKTKAAEKSKTAYRNVSFPKLQHIDLEGIDFANLRSISVDRLLDCLMDRCERNAEVQMLCLDNCFSLLSEDVERLEEVVVDVAWDGVEQEVSDEDKEYDSDGNTIHSDSEDSDYGYDYGYDNFRPYSGLLW